MLANDDVKVLKGVGDKTAACLYKLNIRRVGDLLGWYPREYDIYTPPVSAGEVRPGEKAAVTGIITYPVEMKAARKLTIVSTTIGDATGKLSLTWYNMPFLRSVLKRGAVYVFRGRIVMKGGRLTMEQPEYFPVGAYDQVCHQMQPLYALTAGLTNKTMTKLVRQVLDEVVIREYLPDHILNTLQLMPLSHALYHMHFPEKQEDFLAARRRLAFDEFFLFVLCMQMLKSGQTDTFNAYPMRMGWKTEEVMEGLPYKLTNAQLKVWTAMEKELASDRLMNRLIQGDVGSGKTILAFLAMIMAYENGYQSALMAPTEVLARQHYADFGQLLMDNGIDPEQAVLLTGSVTAANKRRIYDRIGSGEASFIIGTHALIQEGVSYQKLSLVITDEQHRFGVKQRESFLTKGEAPNVLVMSATPIPRTLAMILYGDLDISILDEKPTNRKSIKNCVITPALYSNAFSFIKKEVDAGHQAYIICPMVEESEEIDAKNVLDYTRELKDRFPDYAIEMLHGRMKAAKKDEIMNRFVTGETQILVSTTVIEVGVNVPNATVMMIENAERFGLAQLHQLRGRVGRGKDQSYCIFVNGSESADTARLEILSKTNDGFVIADEDMKLRGPGDFFGVRQSGLMDFAVADIFRDRELLTDAARIAGELLLYDPQLSSREHQKLREKVNNYLAEKLENIVL